METNSNPDYNGRWAGYRPEAQGSSLYPNEVASDFAFIPFGGGARKCVGDQFAMLEATVAISMLLRYAFWVVRRATTASGNCWRWCAGGLLSSF